MSSKLRKRFFSTQSILKKQQRYSESSDPFDTNTDSNVNSSQRNLTDERFGSTSENLDKKHWTNKKCHRPNISLISSGSNFSNFTGFLNLAILLLILSNARVFLENVLINGIRVNYFVIFDLIFNFHTFPNLLILFVGFFSCLLAVLIEKKIVKMVQFKFEKLSKKVEDKDRHRIDEIRQELQTVSNLGIKIHLINLVAFLVYSTVSVLINALSPTTSTIALAFVLVAELKLWSYVQTNWWYRDDLILKLCHDLRHKILQNEKNQSKKGLQSNRSKSKSISFDIISSSLTSLDSNDIDQDAATFYKYPMNIRYRNMVFFVLCPTLCYEINFPRTSKIRFPFIFRRLLEIFILIQVEFAMIQQWIVPILETALPKMLNKDATYTIEKVLRLVLPNHIVWLTFFYLLFHSYLNLLAEICRFSDREFYRDWWNAKDILQFWKLWNIPVHKWCVRHLYKPLLRSGYSKMTANLLVFTFSAVFHEYLISVPMKMLRFYAFSGMIAQIPLAIISGLINKITGRSNFGNMIVWLSLICGQPVACLMYVFDHYNQCNTIGYWIGI